jgi:HK97 family phage major capsid protein
VDIRKALDLSSSAAAYLIPQVIDGAIRDFASKEPTLYNAVRHIPWATNTYFIRKRLSLPGASWSTDGGPLPAATQSEYGRASKSMKYLYTRGEVTGPMQAAAGSLFDALATEVEAHSRAMIEKLSTDIATANGGSNDITGILYQITDDTTMGDQSVKSVTGTLTLAMIDEAIDQVNGDPDTILTSKPVRRKINSLLQAQQQFVNTTEIRAGFRVVSYDDLPILTDAHWSDNGKILIFDRDQARLLVHKDLTYEELAKTKDSTDFMIKGYFGFALEGSAVLLTGFTL